MENKPVKKPSKDPNTKGSSETAPPEPRRGFVTKAAAVAIGGAITICPVAAGVAVFIDPLTRKSIEGRKIRVASLNALPDDGIPRQFPVIVDHRDDAWNRFHNEPIGSVFLRRTKENPAEITAFNATCPHAGCFVSFKDSSDQYACPCHESAFNIDGKAVFGPSPRGLDSLKTEVDKATGDIFVIFQEFYTGIAEKKPKT
jgi:menaquinol-cytochrome c reductase iron-sulfur subunit